MGRPTWDETFFVLCHEIAKRSKDQNTQIGCIIVGREHEVLSMGYNCFPRGIDDNVPERQQRPFKYHWFEHAERNAIYNAARNGIRLEGSILYVPWIPCSDCGRAIIQCGIHKVVVESLIIPDHWSTSCNCTLSMFKEAGVEIHEYC